MTPWVRLADATAPDGGALRLMRRGHEFSIRVDGAELMNNRLSGSEEALATLSIARIPGRKQARILIGGLGMGFTLRAAQNAAGAGAALVVAEIVPEVIEWAKGPMAEMFGDCLSDPRVTLRAADVGEVIRADVAAWDAILLDVDNGPEGMTRPGNDSLYGEAGLEWASRALRPGGVLAVWSAVGDPAFTRRLRTAGFEVEVASTRASRTGKGAKHTIWLAIR